jgi:hypothetical protein
LDIGAHWGYHCHRFEELGFRSYALEDDPVHLYFLRKLKRAQKRQFRIIPKSALHYYTEKKYDIVLSQYVFHHFLKKKESYELLIKLLKRLKMRYMFLGCHQYTQKGMAKAYINLHPDEMVEFVIKNSNLRRASFLGEEYNYRKQYLLEA